ncbi:hypothetical protein [Methanobacterium sp.]|jgi:hypothetical protein
MVQCPVCEDTEKIRYMASYLTEFCVEVQFICGNCGNIFRETVDADE